MLVSELEASAVVDINILCPDPNCQDHLTLLDIPLGHREKSPVASLR
jgi:hypothetical protein